MSFFELSAIYISFLIVVLIMGFIKFDKKLKNSDLHQLMQARKNRIISAMSGQFQSGLSIFKTNRNTNWGLHNS